MSIATKGVHRRRPAKTSLQSGERLKRYAYIFGFSFFFVVMAPADIVSDWLEELAPGSLWTLRYALIAVTLILYAVKGEKALFCVSSNLSRYHRSPGLVPAISKRRYRE